MIRNLHLLRGVVALVLVAFHFGDAGLLPGGGWMVAAPNASIAFFLLLSGYLMVRVSRDDETATEFMRRRLCRLAPLYWVATLGLFAVSLRAPDLVASRPGVADLVRSLLFIPYARANGVVQPLLFVGWTINLEVAFYLCVVASRTVRPRAWRWGALCVGLLSAVTVGWALGFQGVAAFYTQPQLLSFVLGISLAVGERHVRRLPAWAAAAALLLGAAVIVVCPGAHLGVGFYIAGAFTMMLGLLGLEFQGFAQRLPGAMRLGDISYSVYLVHAPLCHVALFAAHRLHVQPLVVAPPAFLAVIALSAKVHDWVEKPLTGAANRLTAWVGDRRRRPDGERGRALAG